MLILEAMVDLLPGSSWYSWSTVSFVIASLMPLSLALFLSVLVSTGLSFQSPVDMGEMDLSVGVGSGIDVSTTGPPKLKAEKFPSKPSVCLLFLISARSSSVLFFCSLFVGGSSTFLLKLRRLGEWNVIVSRFAMTFRITGPSAALSSSLIAGLGRRVCSAVLTRRRELGAGGFALVESLGSVLTRVKGWSSLLTDGGGDG